MLVMSLNLLEFGPYLDLFFSVHINSLQTDSNLKLFLKLVKMLKTGALFRLNHAEALVTHNQLYISSRSHPVKAGFVLSQPR